MERLSIWLRLILSHLGKLLRLELRGADSGKSGSFGFGNHMATHGDFLALFVYFCNKLCGTTRRFFGYFLCTSATSYVELHGDFFGTFCVWPKYFGSQGRNPSLVLGQTLLACRGFRGFQMARIQPLLGKQLPAILIQYSDGHIPYSSKLMWRG